MGKCPCLKNAKAWQEKLFWKWRPFWGISVALIVLLFKGAVKFVMWGYYLIFLRKSLLCWLFLLNLNFIFSPLTNQLKPRSVGDVVMAASHVNKQEHITPPGGETRVGDNGNLIQSNYKEAPRQNHVHKRGHVTHTDNPNVNNNCNYNLPNQYNQALGYRSCLNPNYTTKTSPRNENRYAKLLQCIFQKWKQVR